MSQILSLPKKLPSGGRWTQTKESEVELSANGVQPIPGLGESGCTGCSQTCKEKCAKYKFSLRKPRLGQNPQGYWAGWRYLHDGALRAVERGQHRFLEKPGRTPSLLTPRGESLPREAEHCPAPRFPLLSPPCSCTSEPSTKPGRASSCL